MLGNIVHFVLEENLRYQNNKKYTLTIVSASHDEHHPVEALGA